MKSPTGPAGCNTATASCGTRRITARFQIDAAEKASVIDVLAAFVTGKRDAGREMRPVYYMPAEITPNPLPGPSGEARVCGEDMTDIFHVGSMSQSPGRKPRSIQGGRPGSIDHLQGTEARVDRGRVRDGSDRRHQQPGADQRRRRLLGDRDGDSGTRDGSLDVLYNHRLFSLMSLPVSGRAAWEWVTCGGRIETAGRPPAILGMVAPPLYWSTGCWRNEIGAQAKGYDLSQRSGPGDGYGGAFLRSSVEVAT